jgi:hypothetical protein
MKNETSKIHKAWKVIKAPIKTTFSHRFGIISMIALVATCLVLLLALIEKKEILQFKYHLNPFSTEDYRWLLSAIAQSMAALFGIGGMFSAYILQIVTDRIREYETTGRNLLVGWGHKEFLNLSGHEFVSKLKEYNEKNKSDAQNPYLSEGMMILKSSEKNIFFYRSIKKLLIRSIKRIALFLSVIIFLSLVAIPFSSHLSRFICGFIFMILILFLIMICLLKLVRFISAAISI